MKSNFELDMSDQKPTQRLGESNAEFRQRELSWLVGRANPTTVPTGIVGVPSPTYKYGGVGSPALGGFQLERSGALPPPSYSKPAAPSAPPLPELAPSPPYQPGDPVDPAYDYQRGWPVGSVDGGPAPTGSGGSYAVASTGPFAGPTGSIGGGLRAPRDAAPAEIGRELTLLATGFDLAWGAPPSLPGLNWNTARLVYEGSTPAGVPDGMDRGALVGMKGHEGLYLQAVRNSEWSQRWVRVFTPFPTTFRPYQILSRTESDAIDREIGTASMSYIQGAYARESLNRRAAVVPSIRTPKSGPASAYVWVPASMLPSGMPISGYSEVPVPRADYYSGVWKSPGYRPGIPLPPGYERVAFVPPTPYAGPLLKQ